jgi:hypothetical protein
MFVLVRRLSPISICPSKDGGKLFPNSSDSAVGSVYAAVVSVLDAPVFDNEPEGGSTYFRDPLSLVLGVIWDRDPGRGDFDTFHFEGRRFEPWVG